MDLSSQPGSKGKSEATGSRSDSPPLHTVEHVKFRTDEHGKSPIGTLTIYEKRVVWSPGPNNPAVDSCEVAFREIQTMKLSSPDKPKVQLQLVTQRSQVTFVFLNPHKEKSELIAERNAVKDVLSGALVTYRRKYAKEQERLATAPVDPKKGMLLSEPHLFSLYSRLAGPDKYLTPDEFWSLRLPKQLPGPSGRVAQPERMGVSAGFLASVVDTASYGGINLKLDLETRQAIFRTYPAVENKHLELVPHVMTEEEFWKRFFESHYFHRERSETNPADTFFDCLKLDEQDMQLIQAQSAAIMKRQRDLANLDDDLGLISELRNNQVPVKGNLAKSMLLRRCNYHSERILEDIKAASAPVGAVNGDGAVGKADQQRASTSRQFDLELDSHELQQLTEEDAGEGAPRKLNLKSTGAAAATIGEDELKLDKRRRDLAGKCAGNSIYKQGDSFMVTGSDKFIDMLLEMEKPAGDPDEPMTNGDAHGKTTPHHDLSPAAMEEVRTVHYCNSELLRHYWRCHPITSNELRDKARRMIDSLLRFEKEVIDGLAAKYGESTVAHCRFMLNKARDHYELYKNITRQ